ncbi:hypothetical protein BVRB_2g024320 [Beta vulgaris subsp. vulgaris]|nr:hypothetical protein BVRB_2g024320 [Beta vulgaris subsp. vulgaris]
MLGSIYENEHRPVSPSYLGSGHIGKDLSLNLCTTAPSYARNCIGRLVSVDMLSSLPDELLIRILSLLPTKDVAAICSLSRRLMPVFPWITTLDLDDSPIVHCLKHPYAIQRFPNFVAFVDTVLGVHQSSYLTRFRLGLASDFSAGYLPGCCGGQKDCFPDLNFTLVKAWICFPIARYGLRELDLHIHLRQSDDCQLPTEIFTCETLEVLKIDVNLGLDQVSTMPSFNLPNLKKLHLSASLFPDDGLVSRLVSSCPLLEDLTAKGWWKDGQSTIISSPSLRRLALTIERDTCELDNPDFVLIQTPNLEHLDYADNLALHYSVPSMQSLHLYLHGSCMKDLDFVEVKDQLPLFPNLKNLSLDIDVDSVLDRSLLAFLNSSPVLETLVFPRGLGSVSIEGCDDDDRNRFELNQEFCRSAQAIPSCCKSHLKRIEIKIFYGLRQEVDLIEFMLRHALFLEELVIRGDSVWLPKSISRVDKKSAESTLKMLPRASANCSIQVM